MQSKEYIEERILEIRQINCPMYSPNPNRIYIISGWNFAVRRNIRDGTFF